MCQTSRVSGSSTLSNRSRLKLANYLITPGRCDEVRVFSTLGSGSALSQVEPYRSRLLHQRSTD